MRFQKGQSGNPRGRAKKTPELREVEALARQAAPLAVQRLVHWARSNDPGASVRACTALLDRGFGKPMQPIDGDVTLRMVVQAPQPIDSAEEWAAQNTPAMH